ncbi:MAG: MFS transporter [Thermodesulfobacteriota bacterium]
MLYGLDKHQKRNFNLVTLANFFLFCNFSSFFLLPLFIKSLGGSEAQIGFIMGSFGITSLGSLPIVGYLIDKYGRRKFMLLGAAVMSLASFGNLFITEIGYLIYIPRLLQGVGFAFFFTSAATAAADFVPFERRGQGLGIFGAFTIASYAIGPPVGEALIDSVGFKAFFIASSSFSLIACALAYASEDADVKRAGDSSGLDFFRLAFSSRFAPVFLTNLALAGGFGAFLNFISTYLKSKELNVYYFFLTYSIVVTAVRVFAGRISDVVDRTKIVAPSLLFFSIALGAISLIDRAWELIVVALLFSLSYGMLYPTLSALVMDKAMDTERGKAMGAFNATFSFGINFLAFGFGLVAEGWGYEGMYLAAAVFSFVGFLIFVSFELKRRG